MRATGPPLVCTGSTVRDSLANVTGFVARNLAAGADHMFVFVDDAAATCTTTSAGGPRVTSIPTDDACWSGRRPAGENSRQIVNANLVSVA